MSGKSSHNNNTGSSRKNRRTILYTVIAAGIIMVSMATVLLLLNKPAPSTGLELKEKIEYAHPGNYNLSINVNGVTRSYRVHVPPGYDDKTPLPLVIVLHWWGGNSKSIEEYTGFSYKADREKFIVIYPQGMGPDYTWNAGFCCGQAFRNRVNDVEFIRRIVEKTQADLKIDSKRIYAVGVSNGGMMAYRLGAELSEVFAAIAVASGSIGKYSDGRLIIANPSKPVSIIAFHGKKDSLIPYEGGESMGYLFASVNESIMFWVRVDKCSETPQIETSSNGRIVKETYTGGVDSTEVVLYTITDGDHDIWNNSGIHTTDIIWDFFKKHPKP